MTELKIVEEKVLSLVDVKGILHTVEKRDQALNTFSQRAKEYAEAFVALSKKQREELHQKLLGLELTRLKEEHIVKIIDFLPRDANELKVVLQAYPLSLPKKDQDAIVAVIKEYTV